MPGSAGGRGFARRRGGASQGCVKRRRSDSRLSSHSARSEAESQNLQSDSDGLCMPSLARVFRLRSPPVSPSMASRSALRKLRFLSAAPTGPHPSMALVLWLRVPPAPTSYRVFRPSKSFAFCRLHRSDLTYSKSGPLGQQQCQGPRASAALRVVEAERHRDVLSDADPIPGSTGCRAGI